MFDEVYKSIPLTDEAIKAFHEIRNIQVYGYCYCCKKRIKLNWNESLILVGDFKVRSGTMEYSEIFEIILPCFNSMICLDCCKYKLKS